jgi:hypothetical protein
MKPAMRTNIIIVSIFVVRDLLRFCAVALLELLGIARQHLHDVLCSALDGRGKITGLEARQDRVLDDERRDSRR